MHWRQWSGDTVELSAVESSERESALAGVPARSKRKARRESEAGRQVRDGGVNSLLSKGDQIPYPISEAWEPMQVLPIWFPDVQ
jgi:hypothetical protein